MRNFSEYVENRDSQKLNEFLGFRMGDDDRKIQKYQQSLKFVKYYLLEGLDLTMNKITKHAHEKDDYMVYNIANHFHQELIRDIEQYDPEPKFVKEKRARKGFEQARQSYATPPS